MFTCKARSLYVLLGVFLEANTWKVAELKLICFRMCCDSSEEYKSNISVQHCQKMFNAFVVAYKLTNEYGTADMWHNLSFILTFHSWGGMVKLSLCLTKHHAMKTCAWLEV
jgi:hypothetical protein